MSGDDSSSSEDEITKRILEDSIDDVLLTDDLYNKTNDSGENPLDKIGNTNSLPTKPSLRYIIEDDDHHHHNFIKVTPEFQKFVAKCLFKHLESQIIEKKFKHKKRKVNNTDDSSKGIHLFSRSTKFLNTIIDEPSTKRKRYDRNISDKLILQRASETAVSPDWIFNKDAIQGWTKMTKGKIIKVKENDEGTFDIIDD